VPTKDDPFGFDNRNGAAIRDIHQKIPSEPKQ
jgi:hypothetical protein